MPFPTRQTDPGADFDSLHGYFSNISKYPLLTVKEERELAERAFTQRDSAAYQKLVLSNLRLVVKVALTYYSPYLNLFDLIQEGNLGLIRAVKKYNPRKGSRFSTYAFLWIRACILRHIMALWGTVKIGTTDSERKVFYGLNKAKRELYSMGIEPTIEDLAQVLDVNEAVVQSMENRLSPDLPLDFIGLETSEGQETIEEIVAAKERSDVLHETIAGFKKLLDERELFILENRIMADCPLTLDEIGKHFGISRERVRQLQTALLKKLKANVTQSVWIRRLGKRN